MNDGRAARTAQIADARVEVAKLDEAIAKLKSQRTTGSKVKRLQADAKISKHKSDRAHYNRIIKDRAYARNY